MSTHPPDSLLRPFWQRFLGQAWIVAFILFVLLGALRAYAILGPSKGSGPWLVLVFVSMGMAPFIFLPRPGRQRIGLTKVLRPAWLIWGPLLGALGAFVIFGVGVWLYGRSSENWYISVLESYLVRPEASQLPKSMMFVVFTLPVLIFSPLGEEFFFRGFLHEAVKERWGARTATWCNAIAFGAIHILHHGLSLDASGWHLKAVSGTLWVLLMIGQSWLFTLCRQRGGSIWPAVLAHAAFNLMMNITIFLALM